MSTKGSKPLKPAPKTKQITIRVPWDVWQFLSATAGVFDKAQGEVVTAALTCYFEHLPPDKRKVIEGTLAMRLANEITKAAR